MPLLETEQIRTDHTKERVRIPRRCFSVSLAIILFTYLQVYQITQHLWKLRTTRLHGENGKKQIVNVYKTKAYPSSCSDLFELLSLSQNLVLTDFQALDRLSRNQETILKQVAPNRSEVSVVNLGSSTIFRSDHLTDRPCAFRIDFSMQLC